MKMKTQTIQKDFIGFFRNSVNIKPKEIGGLDFSKYFDMQHDAVFYMLFNTEKLKGDFLSVYIEYIIKIKNENNFTELQAVLESKQMITDSLNNFMQCISSDFNVLYNYFSSGLEFSEIDLIEFKYNSIMSAGKTGAFARALDHANS